jgi:vacuolar-type H+-ATPase subunit F/Vma7
LSKVLAIVSSDLGTGFALTGVEVSTAADAGAARAALESAIAGRAYALVIVEEELMAAMEPELRTAYSASTFPLVIEVSGAMAWREAAEGPSDDYVARLIRRAVGYQLNIKL